MAAYPPLFMDALSGDFDPLRLGPHLTDERTCHGSSALHFAILGGNIDTITYLLRKNFDPNLRNVFGETPLHWACKQGDRRLVEILLLHQAKVQLTDAEGNTPLHWAAEYDSEDIITLLLLCGASLSDENDRGWTPYQTAVEHNASKDSRRILRPQSPRRSVVMIRHLRNIYERYHTF